MKTMTTFASILAFLFLALPAMLLSGCGSDVAKSQACPSGSYLANSTDILTGPADATFVGGSTVGSVYGGGSIPVTPIMFTVTDINLEPRNNICLTVFTGDTATGPGPFWYTDVTYGTIFTGTGPYNYRTVVTNDTGVAILYWSTATLPVGMSRVFASAGPPITYTAGADQAGTSFIQVDSGTKSAIFNFNWTVKGEPAL
jgi:hypothetical protein